MGNQLWSSSLVAPCHAARHMQLRHGEQKAHTIGKWKTARRRAQDGPSQQAQERRQGRQAVTTFEEASLSRETGGETNEETKSKSASTSKETSKATSGEAAQLPVATHLVTGRTTPTAQLFWESTINCARARLQKTPEPKMRTIRRANSTESWRDTYQGRYEVCKLKQPPKKTDCQVQGRRGSFGMCVAGLSKVIVGGILLQAQYGANGH